NFSVIQRRFEYVAKILRHFQRSRIPAFMGIQYLLMFDEYILIALWHYITGMFAGKNKVVPHQALNISFFARHSHSLLNTRCRFSLVTSPVLSSIRVERVPL